MSVVIIIPARFESSRYPGKPLVPIKGATGEYRSLIQRSFEAACRVSGVSEIYVATDDARIKDAATAFGANVLMTSKTCRNGTERCAEALKSLPGDVEMVINLQGDAPLTPAWFIEEMIADLRSSPEQQLATPVLQCDGESLAALRNDRRHGRVGGTTAVFGAARNALYFSKEIVPYCGHYAPETLTPVFHHVGAYAYRPAALRAYATWPEGVLERLEGLEQLRFMENGAGIICTKVEARGLSFWELNNPEDLDRIENMLLNMNQP